MTTLLACYNADPAQKGQFDGRPMYTSYFGLKEKPFSITPDPRYLYLSERHAEALAHLLYGVTESGGFIQLTGEVGTGKTTLVRSMLEQLPTHVDVALILNPRLSANEFLAAICHEIHAPLGTDPSPREMVNALNTRLLEAHADGRRVVLIVDEAQNLSADVLEQVRLLTNLETAKQKLLQIILIGQPELRELLARNDLRQLAQRITGRYHLDPLVRSESIEYLRHRLQVAGAAGEIFKPSALKTVHNLAGGVPRLMNVIADRALLGAYSSERKLVTPALVRAAAAEVLGGTFQPGWRTWAAVAATVAAVALIGFGLGKAYRIWRDAAPASVSTVAAERSAATSTQTASATDVGSGETTTDPVSAPPPATAAPTETRAAEPVAFEPAPAEPPPQPDLAELLARFPTQTDTDSAFTGLFSLWGVDYQSGQTLACDQAQRAGLRCMFQQGALGSLRKLNRPAIMSLRDRNGEPHHLVLAGLGFDDAELLLGGERFTISVADLTTYWDGDYLLLWRPYTATPTLSVGMRGEDVVKLRRGLESIDGNPLPADDPALFDDVLAEHVRRFQRSRQLAADGIVGARTQIALSTELGPPDTPLLTEES